MHMVARVRVVTATLVLRQACKGVGAPSLASSWPSHKWAGCTRGRERRKIKLEHRKVCSGAHEQLQTDEYLSKKLLKEKV